MSNKAITTNDLKAVLDVVLPPQPSEYRKLLWTNTQGAQSSYTVTANFSEYDEIEIVFDRNGDLITKRMGNSGSANFRVVWLNYITERTATISGNTMTIGNGGYYGGYNSGSLTAGSSYAVPTKIYGIKYERVAPPQAEIADVVIEQGSNANGSYRKWESGAMEQWSLESAASASAHAVYFPKSFISTSYVVVGTNTSGTQANFMTSCTNAAYFTVYPTASTQLFWIAYGKWK